MLKFVVLILEIVIIGGALYFAFTDVDD